MAANDGSLAKILMQQGFPAGAARAVDDAISDAGIGATASSAVFVPNWRRAPTAADNAALGFAVNDIWQHNGRLWTLASFSTSGEALWRPEPFANPRPADIFGAACVAAYGTAQMVSGFTGNAVEVIATVSGAATTTSIAMRADGKLDESAAGAAIAKADSGTYVRARFFDQKGTNHTTATGTNGATSPLIDYLPLMGSYALCGHMRESPAIQSLNIPNTVSVTENNFSVFVIGQVFDGADHYDGGIMSLGTGNGSGGVSTVLLTNSDSGSLCAFTRSNGAANPLTPDTAVPSQVTPCVVGMSRGAGNIKFLCNEDIRASTGAMGTNTLTGGTIGSQSSWVGSFQSMQIVGVIIVNRVATDAEILALRKSIYAMFNIRPQVKDEFFQIGDSRAAGQRCLRGQNIPMMLAESLKSDVKVFNLGRQGASTSYLTTRTVATLATRGSAVKGKKVVLVGPLGTNDYVSDGSQAVVTAAINTIKSQCNTLSGAGYKVALIPELATITSTTRQIGGELQRAQITAAGAANMGANVLVDCSTSAALMTGAGTSDTTPYADDLHLGSTGNALVAQIAQPIIDNLFAS